MAHLRGGLLPPQIAGGRMFRPVIVALCLALPTVSAAQTAVPESEGQIALSFAPVVKAAVPAVVNIYATRVVEGHSPFAGDPFFEQFFRDFGATAPQVQNALGSGVIVTADGYVVSNWHVVGQATEIRVVLADRREFPARLVLGDQESDLAVLKLEGASDLPVLPFRDSDELEVGDLVLAIGNPFGVGQTVSSGIISGLARSAFQVGDGRGYFVQTDAAINPGNSGGALVDMGGRLVGINTAILTRGGGSNGIGFAIPSNLVRAVVKQAQDGAERFQRPWAGVTAQPVDADMANALGMAIPRGVVLTALHPESPFAKAGLLPADVVLALNGYETNSPQEMMFRINTMGIGAAVTVTYLHDGAETVADLELVPAPDVPDREATPVPAGLALQGAVLGRINPAVIAEFGLPIGAEGVVVLEAAGIAAQVGVQPGDVLLAVNGVPVAAPADVLAVLGEGGRRWALDVIRQGQTVRLRFRI